MRWGSRGWSRRPLRAVAGSCSRALSRVSAVLGRRARRTTDTIRRHPAGSLSMDDVERALLEGTRRVAAEVLAPRAAAVDDSQVPRSHLDALAAVGVLGVHA